MANEADIGNEAADLFLEVALHNAKSRPNEPHYCGRCWNCDEPIREGAFCDADCRDDYEKRRWGSA